MRLVNGSHNSLARRQLSTAMVFALNAILLCSADAQDLVTKRVAMVVPESRRGAGVPADAELQARKARIGRIDVQVDNVFETRDSLSTPYRLANDLHISTHTATIAAQLLFKRGDEFSRQTLDETERLLRGQRYLNDASIQPVRYNEDNTVDVVVRVHDVWTLSPGLSFGRKGGENSTHAEFEDTNFLGLGKQVSLSRAANVDRTAWKLAYKDPNLLGSWWKLTTSYANLSDGGEKILDLTRPFYALDSRWSFDINGSDTTNNLSEYARGHVVDKYKMQEQLAGIGGGISSGLNNGRAIRYLGGVRYESREFSELPDVSAGVAPVDRKYAYPWVGIELVQDQYLKTQNLDQIGRTEDLYLGSSVRAEIGYAATVLGSTGDALMLRGAAQTGIEFSPDQFMINAIDFSGRMEGGELRNGLTDLSTRYYLRQSPRRVLFASASTSFASHLDPERQLLLGGDNGLRGYPLRYAAGSTRALLTLEQRFYTDWQPLKLVNVGAAVFFDAGRSWGGDRYASLATAADADNRVTSGWLKDVGVGLRLGSIRSGLGNVLHLDVAFPLDGGKDISNMQFLVETRRSF